jgi:hypothetical protein
MRLIKDGIWWMSDEIDLHEIDGKYYLRHFYKIKWSKAYHTKEAAIKAFETDNIEWSKDGR